jgi:signal transduction histidine kinase
MSIDPRRADQSSPSGKRLLLVDPDEAARRRLAAALADAGYAVQLAAAPADALAHADADAPDLAVISLELPAAGGVAIIGALKQRLGAAVHVIATLSAANEVSRAAAFSAGTDDLVVHPTEMSDLLDRLAAATRHQQAFVEVRVAKQVADRRMAYGAEASAMLAHDLNNGLAVALLNMQYLRDGLALDADQTDAFETTIRSLRRMSSLVINFVDVARFEDAEVSAELAPALLGPLLASVVDVNASAFPAGVTATVECEPSLTGRFDAALVERVLHNLIGNAARYCRAGGMISVCARPWGAGVEIAVTNAGPPIPEAIRPHLFEKYVRGSGAKRGMGLYFCRLVAESHGGTVHHEATDIGPRFVLRLPGRA